VVNPAGGRAVLQAVSRLLGTNYRPVFAVVLDTAALGHIFSAFPVSIILPMFSARSFITGSP